MTGLIKCFNNECHYHDLDEPDHCSKPLTKIQKCFMAIVRKDGKAKSWYYHELISNQCACGEPKKPRQSFCYKDYISLPNEIQRALYKPRGYEEAYEEAHKWLEENIW